MDLRAADAAVLTNVSNSSGNCLGLRDYRGTPSANSVTDRLGDQEH